MLVTSAGLSRSFWYSAGCLHSAHNPPLMELRVVSLPPTISRVRLPRNSAGSSTRFFVASPCASMEIRSKPGGRAARSCHMVGERTQRLRQDFESLFF